ncbi:hypothetical protein CUMW_273740 [Citrus unshiu]|uniref:RPW8 domain-containing protein n=1 Tax=Citrus unshiu TaxID=55188 RepID=A0A2H5MXU1_CITUN|nr:hypothetical protein CUMW_273740 [Citrus unshiu]
MTVAIKESKSRCSNFRDALNSLENTLSLLSPLIKEMDRLNQELEDSNKREEIIRLFLQQLKKGWFQSAQASVAGTCTRRGNTKKGFGIWILLFVSFPECSRLDKRLIPSAFNV